MKVIVPCCGRSTRYALDMPKWMLPGHDGRPMVALALDGLRFDPEDLVVAILKEHDDRFRAVRGLRDVFGDRVRVIVHDQPTRNQAETVARTLRALELGEPFLVKDSDNRFTMEELMQDHGYVCSESLNNFDSINPRNKSYLQSDQRGLITNIREKTVISDRFSVGGYYFTDPSEFLRYYDRLAATLNDWNREMYLSDVISAMILEGIPFSNRPVSGYEDWGTLHEWKNALRSRRTFLVFVDGFVLERGSSFFHPRYEDVRPNADGIAAIRALLDRGHSVLYLSQRSAGLRELTVRQLRDAGAPPGDIMFDCPMAMTTLVAAPSPAFPLRSIASVETTPSEPEIIDLLLG